MKDCVMDSRSLSPKNGMSISPYHDPHICPASRISRLFMAGMLLPEYRRFWISQGLILPVLLYQKIYIGDLYMTKNHCF